MYLKDTMIQRWHSLWNHVKTYFCTHQQISNVRKTQFLCTSSIDQQEGIQPKQQQPSINLIVIDENLRTRQTHFDEEYRRTGKVPEPEHSHITLPWNELGNKTEATNANRSSNVLVIGDVHGCYDELIRLYKKAIEQNNNKLFQYVILVGDICNKGPESMKVIRFVKSRSLHHNNTPNLLSSEQQQEIWISIRGNHEQGVLRSALELSDQALRQSKYGWMAGEKPSMQYSDDDLGWMVNLPYTIRIPGYDLGLPHDTIIVHAGLIPGKIIDDIEPSTFIFLRNLSTPDDTNTDRDTMKSISVPWASVWNGPEHIIFGHDAKRGLQEYELATGSDTGCVYGKQLTGIILPQRALVQVDALQQYAPIIDKSSNS